MGKTVDLTAKLCEHRRKIKKLKKDIKCYEDKKNLFKLFLKLTIQDLPMATSSAWDKVFESSRSSSDVVIPTKIKPDRVYEIDDYITVIFSPTKEERKQVTLDTHGFGKLNFSSEEFEEFLSSFDCFSSHWTDVFMIIGQYSILCNHNGNRRSIKFADVMTDKYLFHWPEELIASFFSQISKMFKLNMMYYNITK